MRSMFSVERSQRGFVSERCVFISSVISRQLGKNAYVWVSWMIGPDKSDGIDAYVG